MKLHAMIATALTDRVVEEARALDDERRTYKGAPLTNTRDPDYFEGSFTASMVLSNYGQVNHISNSPLQNLITTPSFGMGTTSGSFALKGLTAKQDATIATLLRKAGCIVMGKSNLSVS
jgi:amidase